MLKSSQRLGGSLNSGDQGDDAGFGSSVGVVFYIFLLLIALLLLLPFVFSFTIIFLACTVSVPSIWHGIEVLAGDPDKAFISQSLIALGILGGLYGLVWYLIWGFPREVTVWGLFWRPFQRYSRLRWAVVYLVTFLLLFVPARMFFGKQLYNAGRELGKEAEANLLWKQNAPNADFSAPAIFSNRMLIKPLSVDFGYNNAFPTMFGGTWRITASGSGFTGSFSVPKDGQYDLVVTHGSSYDDGRKQPGYSPITIAVNSEVVVSGFSPTAKQGQMATDRWHILARAGQNTLQCTLDTGFRTHYWIKKIEIIPKWPQS
jgi:hypothetical protein